MRTNTDRIPLLKILGGKMTNKEILILVLKSSLALALALLLIYGTMFAALWTAGI